MNKYVNKVQAVLNLVGGGISAVNEDVTYLSGQTPPSEAEIDAEVIRLQSEYDAQEYARNRKAEYPDWGTQLEKIADDGIDAWKTDMLEPVKAKFPKP